jgi:hypothetical protein
MWYDYGHPLTPPGYSFHGVGDLDVGQVGFGTDNFSEHFTTTEVYRELVSLGYANLRYPSDNLLGVRFEPWHIQVNSKGWKVLSGALRACLIP